MTPKMQTILGIVLIALGAGAVGLQIAEHQNAFSLVAVVLGAIGGQQIGQANARSKRK